MASGPIEPTNPDTWKPYFPGTEIVGRLPVGRQAAVFVIRRRGVTEDEVLKIYEPRSEPRANTLGPVLRAWAEHSAKAPREIVQLREWAEITDSTETGPRYVLWERQEYVRGGNLADLIDTARFDDTTDDYRSLRALVAELHQVIGFCQSLGGQDLLAHRDVKPENVLVRSAPRDGGLTLALGDFGIAQIVTGSYEAGEGRAGFAPRYAAPEVFDAQGGSTAAVDWWALGIMLAADVLKRHPFGPESQLHRLPLRLWEGEADLDWVDNARLKLLLEGLLHREHRKRWKADEVSRWLGGHNPRVAIDDFGYFSIGSGSTRRQPFSFLGQEMHSLRHLADGMQLNWREAIRDYLSTDGVFHGDLEAWLLTHGDNTVAVGIFQSDRSPEAKLASLAVQLGSGRPRFQPNYAEDRSGDLTLANLADVAEAVRAESDRFFEERGPDDEAAIPPESLDGRWLLDLHDHGIVGSWALAGRVAPEIRTALQSIHEEWIRAAKQFYEGAPSPWVPTKARSYYHATILLAVLLDDVRAQLANEADRAKADATANEQEWFAGLVAREVADDEELAHQLLLVEARGAAAEEAMKESDLVDGVAGTARGVVARASGGRFYSAIDPLLVSIRRFEIDPFPVIEGEPVTVRWAVRNADGVTINGHPVKAKDQWTFIPRGSGELRLAARRQNRVRHRTLHVQVDAVPRLDEVDVRPRSVARGQPVVVSWRIQGARQLTIGGQVAKGETGRIDLWPNETGPIPIEAWSAAGRMAWATPVVHVFQHAPMETTVVPVPTTDIAVDVPVVLLPNMEDVADPRIIDLTQTERGSPLAGGAVRPPPNLPGLPWGRDLVSNFPMPGMYRVGFAEKPEDAAHPRRWRFGFGAASSRRGDVGR